MHWLLFVWIPIVAQSWNQLWSSLIMFGLQVIGFFPIFNINMEADFWSHKKRCTMSVLFLLPGKKVIIYNEKKITITLGRRELTQPTTVVLEGKKPNTRPHSCTQTIGKHIIWEHEQKKASQLYIITPRIETCHIHTLHLPPSQPASHRQERQQTRGDVT